MVFVRACAAAWEELRQQSSSLPEFTSPYQGSSCWALTICYSGCLIHPPSGLRDNSGLWLPCLTQIALFHSAQLLKLLSGVIQSLLAPLWGTLSPPASWGAPDALPGAVLLNSLLILGELPQEKYWTLPSYVTYPLLCRLLNLLVQGAGGREIDNSIAVAASCSQISSLATCAVMCPHPAYGY